MRYVRISWSRRIKMAFLSESLHLRLDQLRNMGHVFFAQAESVASRKLPSCSQLGAQIRGIGAPWSPKHVWMFGYIIHNPINIYIYMYMYMYMYILCMCRMIYSQKIIVFRCVQHGCDFVYGPNMDPHVFLSALPQAPSLRQSNWSQPGMVKLQFTNPTDYDVRVEAGGMVRYLSPKNEKSVDRCEFPEGNYQQFRVWYVDSTGHNQLAGPKPYTVKNDPGVDLYGYGSKLGTSIIGWLILN